MLAAVGVAAVLAVGAVMVVSGNDSTPRRADVPNTVAATVDATVDATSAPAQLSPDTAPPDPATAGTDRFVLSDPGLTPYSADIVATPADGSFYWLWSQSGPESPWLSAQAGRGSVPAYAFSNSSRHLVDGVEVVDSADEPLVATVVQQVDAGWWVTVRARGISDTEVVQFAQHVSIVGDRFQDGTGLLDTLRLQAIDHADRAADMVFGKVDGESSYLTTDGRQVTLYVAPATGVGTAVDRLAYYAHGLATDSAGRIRGVLDGTGDSMVTWFDHLHRFTLVGPLAMHDLAGLSDAVQPVTETDWAGRVHGLHPDYRLGPFSVNGGGETADHTAWTAGVQLATRDGRTLYLWWWTRPTEPDMSSSTAVPVDLATQSYVDTVVVQGATYVFVGLPSPTQTVPVTVTGGDGVRRAVAMVQVAGAAVLVGVARVDTPGAVSVSIGN